jgi:hypothetical protein
MNEVRTRRTFLGSAACTGGCALLASATASLHGAEEAPKKTHDFEKLTFCCFECRPELCPLLEASLGNDLEYKKKEAEEWRKKYKRTFAVDEVFCFGCKTEFEKQGANIKACTVRACVVGKGLVSCAHCRDLAACQQSLWVNYPKFRERVLGIQKDVLG